MADTDDIKRSSKRTKAPQIVDLSNTDDMPETRNKTAIVNKNLEKFWKKSEHETIVIIKGTPLLSNSFRRLRPGVMLNDEVLNSSMSLLKMEEESNKQRLKKKLFLNTFWFSKLTEKGVYDFERVKNWTKEKNIFKCDNIFQLSMILTIINWEVINHWCPLVILMDSKLVLYADTLGCTVDDKRFKFVEENILKYLKDEWTTERTPLYPSDNKISSSSSKRAKSSEFEELGWEVSLINVPQQLSGSNDCGIGSLLFLFQMFKFEEKIKKGDKLKYPYDGKSYTPFRLTLAASLLDNFVFQK